MLIIGLGQAGCSIAKLFKQHKQYHVELLDEDSGIKKQKTVEGYDSIAYKPRKKAIKSASEGILFVCGSGKIAGATLRVLEGISHVKMTVIYLIPDVEYLSDTERRRHKVHFNVLQQYARSGMISEFMIVDNKTLVDLVGTGTVYNYYEKVNHYIYSSVHTLNYCQNTKPEFGKIHSPKEHSRITTVGWGLVDDKDEKLFFLLDNITETRYIISINQDELNNDVQVLPNVQGIVRENKKLDRESSFALWSTKEEKSYYYVKHYTHYIQEDL
jgi:hypothetical protein